MGNRSSKSKSYRTDNIRSKSTKSKSKQTCLSPHSFGSHGPYIKLSGDHNETMKIVKKSRKAKLNRINHSVYGIKSHPSTSGFIKYKIKINALSGVIGIGIISNDSIKKDCFSELEVDEGSFYSYWSNGEKRTNNPRGTYKRITSGFEGFGAGDIIYVSMDNGKCTFERVSTYGDLDDDSSCSGKDEMIEFDDIAIGNNIEYKLVISAERNGDSVTIEKETNYC